MADLNVTYNGYVENFKRNRYQSCKGPILPLFGCVGGWEEFDAPEPEEWTKARDEFNIQSPATVEAVKVPYTVGSNRMDWLLQRKTAIDRRVNFIRERLAPIQSTLTRNGAADEAEAIGLTISKIGVVTLPVLGAAIDRILSGVIASDNADELAYAKTIASRYADDLKELADIRTQILTEYVKAGTTTGNAAEPVTTNEGANPNTKYYYIAGAFVLLIFLLYMRNRNKRKRR